MLGYQTQYYLPKTARLLVLIFLGRKSTSSARQSPIIDVELSQYLAEKETIISKYDLEKSVSGADYVIVATPTNYDDEANFFDTSSVESVIEAVRLNEPNACIVIKSTIPVGFTDDVRFRMKTHAVIFSPEFLREGKALFDNLYPSRIIVGEKSKKAEVFASLLAKGSLKSNVDILKLNRVWQVD